MSKKLSPLLVSWLDSCSNAIASSEEVGVIVTVCPGTDPDRLAQLGLRLEHRYEAIPAVSGKACARVIKALAELDEVESVEPDGTVEALQP